MLSCRCRVYYIVHESRELFNFHTITLQWMEDITWQNLQICAFCLRGCGVHWQVVSACTLKRYPMRCTTIIASLDDWTREYHDKCSSPSETIML
ncbi:hypothetical protein CEXT_234471 [Caerostris extrusa]|uniref:Uncharacterized protein n=1 Tax=Caerostris extrusa TaxID=172846 RepID=A0AAV4P268_CAEEX|nr:hypothetical protein CEXT_234471 [Caerostris extrusa]